MQKCSSSCSLSSSFEWTTFLEIENDCNYFSSFVKNSSQIFGPRKEKEHFVDFKQFSENVLGYL